MRRVSRVALAALIVSGIGLFGTAGPAMAAAPSTVAAAATVDIDLRVATAPGDPEPEPRASSEPEPEPSPSVGVETPPTTPEESPAEEEDEVVPGEGEPADDQPQQRPATPPSVAVTTIPWSSIIFAGATLALSGVAIFVLARRGRRDAAVDPDAVVDPEVDPDAPVDEAAAAEIDTAKDSAPTLESMIAAGEAMIDSGYPVDRVQDALEDIARVNGESIVEIITFPTAVLVSLGSGDTVRTEVASGGRASLLLFQIEALETAVHEARHGELAPEGLLSRIREIRRLVPPFSLIQRLLASVVLSMGLAMLLDASWAGLGLSGVLGGVVGALMLLGSHIAPRYQALLIVAAAFVVALVVFLVVRMDVDPGIMASLVAPLVVLLPGALLTTGVIELSTGEIIAGSARLASGAMRLVLLAFGILAAAALVGLPSLRLDSAAQPLGFLAPWLGVAVFGAGLVVYQCARPRSLPWIFLVLYVAYSAQVIGGVFLGAVLSGAIGALVMTPVAVLVARQRSGPPAIVSFLPAFLLLVPGALGLAGVTSILDGDASGLATLTTTVATMVAVTLGVLVGLGISSLLPRGSAKRHKPAVDEPDDEPAEQPDEDVDQPDEDVEQPVGEGAP